MIILLTFLFLLSTGYLLTKIIELLLFFYVDTYKLFFSIYEKILTHIAVAYIITYLIYI